MKLPLITAAERNLPSIGSATLLLDSEHKQIADVKWPEDAQRIKRACNEYDSDKAKIAALVEALEAIAQDAESRGGLDALQPHKVDMRNLARKARAALAQAKQS